ncbi:MAG TPA: hypothetical protein VK563_09475 [Puia sp.]|nr:hypothetical protein [Puia sp.]
MTRIKKLYPSYYSTLFMFYNVEEKRSIISLFSTIFANTTLFFLVPSQNLIFTSMHGLITALNIFILAKLLGVNSREYNKRVVKESYGIIIPEYTKAFQLKLLRIIFIKKLATTYSNYDDLLADYEEDYHPNNPNIRKKFISFLLLLFGFFAFIGTFLLDKAALKLKITYLVSVAVFVLIPIIFLYLQFSPIIKEIIKDRFKKNILIISIIKEIKMTVNQFPAKYVAMNDLKTLILNSDIIDESFLLFFKHPIKDSRIFNF